MTDDRIVCLRTGDSIARAECLDRQDPPKSCRCALGDQVLEQAEDEAASGLGLLGGEEEVEEEVTAVPAVSVGAPSPTHPSHGAAGRHQETTMERTCPGRRQRCRGCGKRMRKDNKSDRCWACRNPKARQTSRTSQTSGTLQTSGASSPEPRASAEARARPTMPMADVPALEDEQLEAFGRACLDGWTAAVSEARARVERRDELLRRFLAATQTSETLQTSGTSV